MNDIENEALDHLEPFLEKKLGVENAKQLVTLWKLQKKPELQDFIRNANEEYWTKDELKRHKIPEGMNADILWQVCKFSRASWAKQIVLKRTGFKLTFTINNLIQQRLHQLDLKLGGNHLFPDKLSKNDEQIYLINSLMEEAIASSQIEGAATSREAAKELLRTGRKPINYAQMMVLNNYNTMRMLKEIAKEPLTLELLCKIQASITKGTLDNTAEEGNLRLRPTVVEDTITKEVVHVPPAADKLNDYIADLCDFVNNKDETFIHPIIKASLLHFLMGYIHPFTDGNGRTARSLFYWYLIARDYALVEFLPISRIIRKSTSQYAKAYKNAENDENDTTYFILYSLQTLERTVDHFDHYITRKVEERDKAYSLLRIPGVTQRQTTILQNMLKLPERPISIKEVQQKFNLDYQIARLDMLNLEKLGLIERQKANKRLMIFFATQKLKEFGK